MIWPHVDERWLLRGCIVASVALSWATGWFQFRWGALGALVLMGATLYLARDNNDSKVVAMMQESLAAHLLTDSTNRVIWCNRALRSLLAVDSPEAEVQVPPLQPLRELLVNVPSIATALEAACRECMVDSTVIVELADNTIDALVLQAHISTTTTRDSRLENIHSITIVDVTEQKRAKDEVSAAQALAENEMRANKAKTDVVQMLSHELRTPLQGIIGVTSMMLEEAKTGDPEQLELRSMVMASARLLLTLINNVLDVGKVDAGVDLHFAQEPVSAVASVEEAVQFIRPFAITNNAHLTIHKECASWIAADQLRLNQILINLLSNAVRYSNVSGIVEISVSCTSWGSAMARASAALSSDVQREPESSPNVDNEQACVIVVRDHGPGLPSDKSKQLFAKFGQLQSGDPRNITGTGLGLHLCYQFAREMGGHIFAETCEIFDGGGSIFGIFFPVIEHEAPTPHSPEEIEALFAMPLNFCCMVVDDNTINLRITRKMLHVLGAKDVVVCRSGESALLELEAAPADKFDLIMTDIQMPPNMDGFQFASKIPLVLRGALPPVVAVTADTTAATRNRCLAAGISDVVYEPCTLTELQRLIMSLPHSRAARQVALESGAL